MPEKNRTTVADQPGRCSLYDKIHSLMTGQPYAVLCTQGDGQPYGSVIAFAANPELNAIVFVTPVDTRKYRLLCACDQVALVVDNRAGSLTDDNLHIDALTASGRAIQLHNGDEIDLWKRVLLQRHPLMQEFICASDNALFRVNIQRYIHVTRLNEVSEWSPPHAA